jgi:hypothetical protein
MNTLCLENYGVSKMETREMKTTDGGGWILAVVGWYLYETLKDTDAFLESFGKGVEAAKW